jgi:hypothetical protein
MIEHEIVNPRKVGAIDLNRPGGSGEPPLPKCFLWFDVRA